MQWWMDLRERERVQVTGGSILNLYFCVSCFVGEFFFCSKEVKSRSSRIWKWGCTGVTWMLIHGSVRLGKLHSINMRHIPSPHPTLLFVWIVLYSLITLVMCRRILVLQFCTLHLSCKRMMLPWVFPKKNSLIDCKPWDCIHWCNIIDACWKMGLFISIVHCCTS
jgi:hypothetical protein